MMGWNETGARLTCREGADAAAGTAGAGVLRVTAAEGRRDCFSMDCAPRGDREASVIKKTMWGDTDVFMGVGPEIKGCRTVIGKS